MKRLRVKELAQERGFNQSSLSRATGLGFNTIKAIFRDPYHNAGNYTLQKIAEVLGVDVGDLYEDTDVDKSE